MSDAFGDVLLRMVEAEYDGTDPDIGPARWVVAAVEMRASDQWLDAAARMIGEPIRGKFVRGPRRGPRLVQHGDHVAGEIG